MYCIKKRKALHKHKKQANQPWYKKYFKGVIKFAYTIRHYHNRCSFIQSNTIAGWPIDISPHNLGEQATLLTEK